MNIIRVTGTEPRKAMLTNIVNNVRQLKPRNKHIDYTVQIESKWGYSELYTREQEGTLRNISQLYINDSPLSGSIQANIGNISGAIDLEKIPFFMSAKKALKKIDNFLATLQPENRVNAISKDTLPAEFPEVVKTQETFDTYKIQTHILGSDAASPIKEVLKRNETL